MEARSFTTGAPAHRLDEFPAGYSLAGCAPALPASASPTASEYAVKSSCRSISFQRTVNSVLTICLTPGGRRKPPGGNQNDKDKDKNSSAVSEINVGAGLLCI